LYNHIFLLTLFERTRAEYDQDPEIIEEAKVYLKKYSEMLPKLEGDGKHVISWPPTALKYLGRIYKPKNRLKAVLMTS
jgi:hypothetical protein